MYFSLEKNEYFIYFYTKVIEGEIFVQTQIFDLYLKKIIRLKNDFG